MFRELNHLGFIKNIIKLINRTRFPAKRRDPRRNFKGMKITTLWRLKTVSEQEDQRSLCFHPNAVSLATRWEQFVIMELVLTSSLTRSDASSLFP